MKLSKFRLMQTIRNMFSSNLKMGKEINEDYAAVDREIESSAPVRKNNFERNLDRLRSIWLHTRKFRVKKKLDKRIAKLENAKLIEVREM